MIEPKLALDEMHSVFQHALRKALIEHGDGEMDENQIEEIVVDAVTEVSEMMTDEVHRSLSDGSGKMLEERRDEARRFAERNLERWRQGFDLLERLIVISEDIGDAVNRKLRPEAARNNDALFEVLISNHSRAVVVSREILALMLAGYPDGALSPWRTLHEIAVESTFVKEAGREMAERYILQTDVVAHKRALNYMEYHARAGLDPMDPAKLDRIKARHDEIVATDPRFRHQYGWAAEALGKAQPTFFDLEEATGLDHWRPRYKWASLNTHGGYGQHLKSLGVSESKKQVLLVGPSNSGMTDPGQMTAISLTLATSPITQLVETIDGPVYLKVMSRTSDEVGEAFWAVQRDAEQADDSPD